MTSPTRTETFTCPAGRRANGANAAKAANAANAANAPNGFTLIELMVAVAIAAIVMAIALPAFNGSMRKSRRSDAFTALAAVQQAEERWRSNNAAYGQLSNLQLSSTSPSGYYTIGVVGTPDGISYLLTATAVSGGSQAQDTGCTLLAVYLNSGSVSYGSGGSTLPLSDPANCWVH
jgi:type IV pilus assembly protein PilE